MATVRAGIQRLVDLMENGQRYLLYRRREVVGFQLVPFRSRMVAGEDMYRSIIGVLLAPHEMCHVIGLAT